ncbi:hypothetical protein BH10PLA1_BH10PLA1_01690 [soil metagenome]
MNLKKISAVTIIGFAAITSTARAGLFDVSVNGSSSSASVKSSSVPGLVDNLLNAQGKFQEFDGQDYTASLKYGGVKNAMTFQSNATGTDVILRIPSTGLRKEFTGNTRDEVQQQIKDFLLKDGSSEYAKFLEQINKQSLLGVVDGNPHATTALMSDHAFRTFGLNRSPARIENSPANNDVASSFRFDVEGGVANNDEANENYVTGSFGTGFVGERFGVTVSTVLNYRDIEGSSFYSVGEELGLPILLLTAHSGNGLSWQLTPTAIIAGGASYDAAAGGTMWGVGIVSALDYRLGNFVFTLADQIAYYKGFNASIGSYEFATEVDQTLLKNGVGVAYLMGRTYVDASVAYTNFLQDAAVDSYWTPSVGFGWKFGTASGLHIAYKGDFGDNYSSNGGEATLYFGF